MDRNARTIRLSSLISLATAVNFFGPSQLRAETTQTPVSLGSAAQGVGTVVDIEQPRQLDADSIEVTLPIPNAEKPIVLHRYSMRAAGFKVIKYLDATTSVDFDVSPPCTFRGEIPTLPGSDVGLSLTPDGINGMIFDGAGGTWFIEPEAIPAERLTISHGEWRRAHRVYRAIDVPAVPNVRCGVSPDLDARFSPVPSMASGESAGGGSPRGGATLSVCEIALDSDYLFFQRAGGTSTAVVVDVEGLMLAIQMIYERDTSIAYSITSIVVRTTPPADPYSSTDSYTLLCQFRNQWNNVLGAIPRDITHLLTGRQLDGSIVGLAWLGVVCNSAGSSGIQGCTNFENLGYGLSESLFTTNYANRINLTAHELGHNWNACHCDQGGCTGGGADADCGIMWSFITGSTTFGSRSINAIVDHRNSRTCLDVSPVPEDDVYEENDSLAQSVPLPFGTTNLVMADAADYFSFTFCETGSITVSASYDSPLNLRLTVLTSGGITLSTVTGANGFATVTRNLAPGGYRILIQRTTGHYGPYVMTVTGPADCNSNSRQDRCDILNATSADCNANNIPDECEADCNENGIPDDCDIASATVADCNNNGVPDVCERGDFDSSGAVDLADLADFVGALLDPLAPCSPLGDLNGDGLVDSMDIQPFVDALLLS